MNTPTSPRCLASTRRRKQSPQLTPAAAHELDVLRAARQGIDISNMAPEERCRYPSKFCCHKRARKTTGKLHRFCEYHRTRARLNQKRWTDIRRQHDHHLHEHELERDQAMAQASHLLDSFADWRGPFDAQLLPLAAAIPLITMAVPPTQAVTSPQTYTHKDTTTTKRRLQDKTTTMRPASPTTVDGPHAQTLPLSDGDIEQLMSMLVEDEAIGATSGNWDLHSACGKQFEDAFEWLTDDWLAPTELSMVTPLFVFE